eukprot:384599-Prorocentrum_lima.AAC.1
MVFHCVGVRKILAKSHIQGSYECQPETLVNTVIMDLSGSSEEWKHWTMACDGEAFVNATTL